MSQIDENENKAPPVSMARILLRILSFVRPYRTLFTGILGYLALALLCELSGPMILGKIIDLLIASGGPGSAELKERLAGEVSLHGAAFLLVGLLGQLLNLRKEVLRTRLNTAVLCDVRIKLYEAIQRLSFRYQTILENLRYARPEASREEVEAIAKALGADEIIGRLPQGYETQVSERGMSLSQGERQLICFVRALVANPRLLILDEATSSVDAGTEERLQSALLKLVKGRTSFVVAHRLSTVRRADRIFVVEGGEIIEAGTHQDLLSAGGRYSEIHREYVRV